MTDLDFDELDKAVSSLIRKKTRRRSVADTDAASESAPPSQAASVVVSASPSTAEPAAASAAAITPIVQSRGRFMDMVHPAADMSKPNAPVMPARPSRQGVTLMPSAEVEAAHSQASSEAEDDTTTDAPVADQAQPAEQPAVEEPSKLPADETWEADDSYTYHEDTAPLHGGEPSEPLIASRDAIETEQASDAVRGIDTAQPASEPQAPTFVDHAPEVAMPTEDTDAAFESGATSTKTDDEILASIDMPIDADADTPTDTPSDAEPTKPAEPTEPAESVESRPMTSPFVPDVKVEKRPLNTPATTPEPSTAVVTESPVADPADDEPQTLAELDQEVGDDLATMDMGLGAQSRDESPATVSMISQQYRTTEKPTDHTASPIYDTDTYHKPVTPAPRGHHAWVVAVWVTLLLILSAVAGAATYYFLLNK